MDAIKKQTINVPYFMHFVEELIKHHERVPANLDLVKKVALALSGCKEILGIKMQSWKNSYTEMPGFQHDLVKQIIMMLRDKVKPDLCQPICQAIEVASKDR